MLKLEYDVKYFDKELFNNDNVIIDNEIANDLRPDWDYMKADVIVVGFLHKDKMIIYVRQDKNDEDAFIRAILNQLEEFRGLDMYAFNRNMESGNFVGYFDCQIDIKELKPFNAKGWNKDRFYNELIGNNIINDAKIADVFNGDSTKCMSNWKKYQDTEQVEYLMDIVKHNMNCLLKESVIQKNMEHFKNNYNINERGWLNA